MSPQTERRARYRYFVAFTRSTTRGETVLRNDVLWRDKRIEDGEDIAALERQLNERAYVPTDHVLLNFILLGTEEEGG